MYVLDPHAPLCQGDIFPDIPSIFLQSRECALISEDPTPEGNHRIEENLPGAWVDGDGRPTSRNVVARAFKTPIIVLSQSCDLARFERAEDGVARAHLKSYVLYCPVLPISSITAPADTLAHIRKNQSVSLFWLPEYGVGDIQIPESVVSFPLVSSILAAPEPTETFNLNSRIASLSPPYREQLASRFANFVSRVATPLAYPVGSTHVTGAPIRERGRYTCAACGAGEQVLNPNAKFPAGHCGGARWRFAGA